MKNITETEAVYLGSLGVMEYFEYQETRYRTIDQAPSTSPYKGTRWCLNMTTLKAEWIACREKVAKEEPPVKKSDK